MGRSSIASHVMFAAILSLTLSACTVTETAENILGSTKDFLSSTTPGDLFTGDGLLKADQKVIAFVAFNFENLTQDMARGRGEYLSSLSELFGIRDERREAFSPTLNPGTDSQRERVAAPRNW